MNAIVHPSVASREACPFRGRGLVQHWMDRNAPPPSCIPRRGDGRRRRRDGDGGVTTRVVFARRRSEARRDPPRAATAAPRPPRKRRRRRRRTTNHQTTRMTTATAARRRPRRRARSMAARDERRSLERGREAWRPRRASSAHGMSPRPNEIGCQGLVTSRSDVIPLHNDSQVPSVRESINEIGRRWSSA